MIHASPLRWADEWGRSRPVLRRLDSLEAAVRPPISDFLAIELASMRADLGDTVGARREAEVAERTIATFGLDTARAELEVARGLLAERGGDCAAAAGHYRTATRLSAINQLPRLYLARCLLRTGRAREAEGVLREVIRVTPSDARARLELARAWIDLGREKEATAQLDTALAIWKDADPDYLPARRARALRASM
jgi:tetratricopeptide (TPR) repeat protein